MKVCEGEIASRYGGDEARGSLSRNSEGSG